MMILKLSMVLKSKQLPSGSQRDLQPPGILISPRTLEAELMTAGLRT